MMSLSETGLSQERSNLVHSHRRHLLSFIESLPQEARLLDVGCGTGKTIRLIRKIRPDIHIAAMDMADSRVFLPADVDFIEASVNDLSSHYMPDSFDAVICQHVIEHLVYPTEMIKGIRFVLKADGRAYIETPNWTRLMVPFSHLWFWNDYTHTRPYSRAAFHRLFDESGFQIDLIKTTSSCSWFPRKSASMSSKPSKTERAQHKIPARGVIARIVARLVNPLLRDVLIGIARKSS